MRYFIIFISLYALLLFITACTALPPPPPKSDIYRYPTPEEFAQKEKDANSIQFDWIYIPIRR